MENKIYEQLKTPKTIEELQERLNEIDIKWNKSQIQLFLEMDPKLIISQNKWSVKEDDIKDVVLDIIAKALGNKPIMPVKLIMKDIPKNITISDEQLLDIALQSSKYVSTNGKTLKVKS
ncbi:MAG: hypothetical protein RR891_10145 [Clostridium sp.]